MPPLLTAASTLQCPHGGVGVPSPASVRAKADAPILTVADTVTIAGCAFSTPAGPHPCVSVMWIVGATRLTHGGAAALDASSVGLCLAADQAPQGAVVVTATQARASGL